ncbi:MAG: hypothetical protein JOZ67_00615, partial [Gammaproteobacteria bacterium]|nr:hypothetical protein [Gammaproteobacteria bacterium]
MPERGTPGTPHTVLAFDFGFRRIGIASADTLTRAPTPRGALRASAAGP